MPLVPPTFRQRKRIPKPKQIVLALRILYAVIPMDTQPVFGWRESLKGVPNFRMQSTTNNKEFTVDIYASGFFVVTIAGRLTEPCKTIPSLVGYLCRTLGVRPKGGRAD